MQQREKVTEIGNAVPKNNNKAGVKKDQERNRKPALRAVREASSNMKESKQNEEEQGRWNLK